MKRIIACILIAITSLIAVSCKTNKVVAPSEETQKLREQVDSKEAEIKSLQKKLDAANAQLAIFEFFNDEEISIFSNNFLEQNGSATKLAGKNKVTYETIRMIADVENKLSDIENNKIPQLQKMRQTKKWSDAELKNAIKLDIKADMDSIGAALDVIDERDLSVLSTKQMDYYKHQCQRFKNISRRYL